MKYKTLNKISTISLIIFVLLTALTGTMCLAVGGILNDLDSALEEIQDLEGRGLLSSPPPDISDIAKREIALVHNSEGLKQYITEVEESIPRQIIALYTFAFLSLATLIGKIYLRRKIRATEAVDYK